MLILAFRGWAEWRFRGAKKRVVLIFMLAPKETDFDRGPPVGL